MRCTCRTPVLAMSMLVMSMLALPTPAVAQGLTARIQAVRAQHAQRSAVKGSKGRILQSLLYKPVTVEFDGTPARAAFEYFATALDINVEVRFADDAIGFGLDPDTPISLSRDGIAGIEVLEEMLEQCLDENEEPATWQLRRSFLEVGTKERLSLPAAQELRNYPVKSMLFEPTRHSDAPYMGIWLAQYSTPSYGPYGGASGSIGGAVGGGRGFGGYGGGYSGGHVSGGWGVPPRSRNSESEMRERGKELIELIVTTVEPTAWIQNGGEWATIQYTGGQLLVRAPDYIHRQIGGYPHVPRPARTAPSGN